MTSPPPPSPDSPPADPLAAARAALQRHFGYPDFRAPQRRAVEAVVSGRDALIVLPTGGGKSLCYQVPALMRDGLTVVVSPLISLMTDQVAALARRGIAATYLNSTLSAAESASRMDRARDGALTLLYLAPERLESERTLQQLADVGVALLAVDEAHCISEWGHDFRPSFRRLGHVRARLGAPQAVALTATATPGVRRDIAQQLALRDPAVVIGGFDRTNLSYHVASVRSAHERDRLAVRWLQEADGAAVVYASTRTAVERVTATLLRAQLRAIAYHGGLDDRLRQRAQDAFMHDRARIIVATNAFGMGIDKPDVRVVVHHAMPGSLEAYYQEAGRAGRDGQPGRCLLLHGAQDRGTHEFFLEGTHPSHTAVAAVWRQLRACSDADGYIALAPDALLRRVPSSVGARQGAAALRALVTARCVTVESPARGVGWVRLLATPTRIRRTLHTGTAERALLRACWQATGARLTDGALIDLDGLPPVLGGARALVPVLERLAAAQFVTWKRHGTGLRLAPHLRDRGEAPLDWPVLERRRRADRARLDAMERYATTRHCRRAFVLRYFGDADVRVPCGACDRCC